LGMTFRNSALKVNFFMKLKNHNEVICFYCFSIVSILCIMVCNSPDKNTNIEKQPVIQIRSG
jgi:hypothetical protein